MKAKTYAFVLFSIFVVSSGQDLTCFHLPLTDILHGSARNASVSYCDQSSLTPKSIIHWNSNLDAIISSFQFRHCFSFREYSIFRNESCMSYITNRLSIYRDRPLCCSVAVNSTFYGCYYNNFNPCKNTKHDSSFASAVCYKEVHNGNNAQCVFNNVEDRRNPWRTCEEWSAAIIEMEYFAMGCYSNPSDLPGVATGYDDHFSGEFMAENFCRSSSSSSSSSSTTDSSPCCGTNLCNSPLAASSASATAAIRALIAGDVRITYAHRAGPDGKVGRSDSADPSSSLLAAALGSVGGLLLLAVLAAGSVSAFVVCRRPACRLFDRFKRRFASSSAGGSATVAASSAAVAADATDDGVAVELLQQHRLGHCGGAAGNSSGSSFSTSGAGHPTLVRRTVARETTVLEPIGHGRFGQVFKGTWRTGDLVAVKMFHSRAEASWSREGEIYSTPGLAHPAILGFVAMDNLDAGWETQLWLITQYHEHGSLQSYLTDNSVSAIVAAGMCHSIVSGLAHLHTELQSAGFRKPRIAHCDVKSNNVLVKADLTCCLADFGLAVRDTDEWTRAGDRRVGTARYLSPELLSASIAPGDFNGLLAADTYALGLTLWEVANRSLPGAAYQLPFDGAVGQNPSLDDMRSAVCPPANLRPPVPLESWGAASALTAALADGVLASCWNPQAALRPQAMELKQITARLLLTLAQHN